MKVQFLLVVATQALLVACQTNSTEAPSEVPYYGLSPPVYPSRESQVIMFNYLTSGRLIRDNSRR